MISFSLMQWNTLSYHLSDKKGFPYANEEYLKWEYREPLIREILEKNRPDILCLEEIGNYENKFKNDVVDK